MVQTEKGTLRLNYSNVFLCFHFNSRQTCQHIVKDHMLVYVYSGELLIESGTNKEVVSPGECVFLPKNHKVNIARQSAEDEQFKAIFLVFDRKFLRKFYQEYEKKLPLDKSKENIPNWLKLPDTMAIKSLFYSLIPFLESSVKPTEELMKLKQQEGLIDLLNIDENLCTTLFDFIEPWKIDIWEFMNDNYMYELSISDIALFTGRSLAAFKRDFQKISSLPPQKWIMQKRLEVAYQEIKEGQKASDIYLKLGFKSLSHFSTAFKKQYGSSPQQLAD